MAFGAAACSGSGGKESEDKGDGASGGKAADTPKLDIAMITHSAKGDAFWDIVLKGGEQAAAKDNVKLHYQNDDKAEGQATLVQNAIDQKMDGIIVTLAKPDAMRENVEKAVKAGIPVVTINSGQQFSKAMGALSHIGQDEGIAGEAVGEQLNDTGRKKAVCVIHEQGNVSLEERCAGVKKTFKGDIENLTVDGADKAGTTASIQSKLEASDDVDAVVALNAGIAGAALKAKGDTGSKAEVSTFDLDKEVAGQLESKEIAFAVDQQPYLQGYLAVDELWLYKTNANVIGGGKPVLTGPAIVTGKDAPALKKYTARGTR
ncbi:sugar ABC transporter substrate-binding protein [Streptomyces sp. A7024]|uniref:Sugar ABC transporter substrate-binding protein n=2 Tax=Streptomyces coryli TaxID=1128680 RepID=A0A6G4U2V6_9ACTN|nr:sugar ABC transporter substrate-binding protein [Streptomyces coryli]